MSTPNPPSKGALALWATPLPVSPLARPQTQTPLESSSLPVLSLLLCLARSFPQNHHAGPPLDCKTPPRSSSDLSLASPNPHQGLR